MNQVILTKHDFCLIPLWKVCFLEENYKQMQIFMKSGVHCMLLHFEFYFHKSAIDLICVQAVCPAYQLDFFHKVEFCALTDFPEKSKSFEKQKKFYPITMWLHGSELNFIKVSYPSLMKLKHFLGFHIKFTLSRFHFVFFSPVLWFVS